MVHEVLGGAEVFGGGFRVFSFGEDSVDFGVEVVYNCLVVGHDGGVIANFVQLFFG